MARRFCFIAPHPGLPSIRMNKRKGKVFRTNQVERYDGHGNNPNVLISESWRDATLKPSPANACITDRQNDLNQSDATTTTPPPYTPTLDNRWRKDPRAAFLAISQHVGTLKKKFTNPSLHGFEPTVILTRQGTNWFPGLSVWFPKKWC